MKIIQKRWFHATTKENWKKIKKEGLLWGIDGKDRYTFLARNLEQLISMVTNKIKVWNKDMQHNQLVLSVRYTPNNIDDIDYGWEMIVKKPILLENLKVLRYL